jgi:hypothetical protein
MGVDAVRGVLGLVAVCERARRRMDACERARLGMGVPVSHHFEREHGAHPHCYVCRREVVRGEQIEIRNVDGTMVWRHIACLPGQSFDSRAEAAAWLKEQREDR